jgi:hypothetical protein
MIALPADSETGRREATIEHDKNNDANYRPALFHLDERTQLMNGPRTCGMSRKPALSCSSFKPLDGSRSLTVSIDTFTDTAGFRFMVGVIDLQSALRSCDCRADDTG